VEAMAKSRKAKPVGMIPIYLPSLTAGPLGHNDAGHPNRPRLLLGDTPGPLGINDHGDPNLRKPFLASTQSAQLRMDPLLEEAYWKICAFAANSVLVTEADDTEFNLFKGKIEDRNVAEYVKHRTEFFGSTAAYRAYAAESDEEHREANYRKSQIEFESDAEKVFYRWVRKAYEDAGVEDVPKMIRSGQSDELRQELAKVRTAYGQGFHAGGFNPRPKKKNGKYRLGTISEHATGMAIDIEDQKNPQLVLSQWKFIEKLAGKTVDLSVARWWENPKDMWQDVKDLNDKFVAKVQAEVARVQKADEAPKDTDDALAEIFKGDREIKDLRKWANGFFTLEWALVEQLHKHHFRWGATFYPGNIDLHHFELAGGKKGK
jgi:hypothetical protein